MLLASPCLCARFVCMCEHSRSDAELAAQTAAALPRLCPLPQRPVLHAMRPPRRRLPRVPASLPGSEGHLQAVHGPSMRVSVVALI